MAEASTFPSPEPAWPLGFLATSGPHADPATGLTWGLIVLSVAVVVIVTGLVVAGLLRSSRAGGPGREGGLEVDRDAGGLNWIFVGMALTMVALAGTLAWTVEVLAATNSPAARPALTIEVTGKQWWWQAIYSPDDPSATFVTANEIHIPVGQPVLVRLRGADVIHSFWVPALAGKTDTIPGRTNVTWLQASRAGTYRGQCTEYCGAQHAHMGFYVVAEAPAAFERWRQAQLSPAAAPDTADEPGARIFQAHCSACHTVRGTEAGGVAGPNLTHLMSRRTLAAATLPNNHDALLGWIANPQALKPGARMPSTYLSGPELKELDAYLGSLS
jgi:cytochrome c oxidase subunit 2